MFVTVCSSISTQSKAFVYQIINQQHGLDKLNASQLAQFNGLTIRIYNLNKYSTKFIRN